MNSSRLLNLVLGLSLFAVVGISQQAHAWGYENHRTYQDHRSYPNGGFVDHTYHGPVFVHPIHPSYPIYRAAPSVYWRTGHWNHTWHDNRFGWWWVNNLGWSFYSAPSYPYPEPVENQTTIIYQAAPDAQTVAPPTNTVVVTAPPAPSAPSAPVPGDQEPPQNSRMYYFCKSSQLYYPYARSCSERWEAVPQNPAN